MESCSYHKDQRYQEENGKIYIRKVRCSSKYNLKLVEFRNPDYVEQSKGLELCESHFREVFRDIIEDEKILLRKYLNAKARYKKDHAFAKKYAEYFDSQEFYIREHVKVDDAWQKYNNLKRKTCRLEMCKVNIRNPNKVFVIRVYPKAQTDYQNLFFCSREHWYKIKLRIGIEEVKEVRPVITLDTYTEKTELNT